MTDYLRGQSASEISPGDVFMQINPAPGYPAESYQVLRPAEREGWWWCRAWFAPGERRKPESSLLNERVHRKLGPNERRRA